ncbi:hypothetical protein FHR92_000604 [Fontibacillus solani]|uniref:Uncharacterized protein n=1 Tax=Fontibacillus solani TaxID=1572857 RepID=A0A7W3SQ22_9BACL|nr:hypothetical protein [Fontibacillus solani]
MILLSLLYISRCDGLLAWIASVFLVSAFAELVIKNLILYDKKSFLVSCGRIH